MRRCDGAGVGRRELRTQRNRAATAPACLPRGRHAAHRAAAAPRVFRRNRERRLTARLRLGEGPATNARPESKCAGRFGLGGAASRKPAIASTRAIRQRVAEAVRVRTARISCAAAIEGGAAAIPLPRSVAGLVSASAQRGLSLTPGGSWRSRRGLLLARQTQAEVVVRHGHPGASVIACRLQVPASASLPSCRSALPKLHSTTASSGLRRARGRRRPAPAAAGQQRTPRPLSAPAALRFDLQRHW